MKSQALLATLKKSKPTILLMLLSLCLWNGVPLSTALAAPVTSAYKKAQSEFVSACRESFRKSKSPTSEEIGKEICECTAKDSKNQGAKASSLKKEAAEIRKNPKHEIQDEHILNAFRWCTIELMRKADHDEADHASE
jgi:hypothetical protein